MAKHQPHVVRAAIQRYHELYPMQLLREDAIAQVSDEQGVPTATLKKWLSGRHRQNIVAAARAETKPEPNIPVYSPRIETLSSSDFELKPAQPQPLPSRQQADGVHQLAQDRNERWFIIPDLQIPYHDQRSLRAVLEYASENHWDGFIQLGDYMDWDFISRWTRENARAAERQRFFEHYMVGNAVLDDIMNACRKQNPNAKGLVLEGNHDYRIEDWINRVPAMEGLIEMETNLRFAERNMTYWKYWQHKQPYVIGKAWFIHGEYIGTHHAKKTADSFHRCVFYGHTHDRQLYTKTTVSEDSVQCESLGTLSVRELAYMGKKPSNWMQCFAEFTFRPDGSFNHWTTNIIDHRFIAINGKEYAG